jgi:glycosyltransferase involved in cell wall biosynthesis
MHATKDGITVHRVVADWRLGRGGARSARAVAGIADDEGIDVVHVFFPDTEIDADYQVPALLGSGARPLVTTFWSLALGRRSPTSLRLSSLALIGRSSVLSSHEPGYLRQLRHVALGRPVRWLPVGSNVGRFEHRAALSRESTWLAYFGQLDITRGIDDLFAALARLRGEGRDVRLLMIGSGAREERFEASGEAVWGEYRRLRQLPGELGIDDAVEWTPFLAPEEVAALLAAADACVFPYRKNSIGRSALAAAFEAGTPVVLAGDAESIAPLQADRHVALVPRAEPESLAATLSRVLDDESLQTTLRAGSVVAARIFAWPRIAVAARSMYEEALAVRGAPGRRRSGPAA